MPYRVLIPTAGTGSRLGKLTSHLNKSLVGIANRPTICHIIERFPTDAEFVIALGHKGNLVREFLGLAYPDRRFFYADVHPFEGPGSGLGLSVQSCKEFLQEPFVFTSCDTLVKEPIPDLSENWMGYAEVPELGQYRTLLVRDSKVEDVCEKGIGRFGTHKAYIGLAGIKEYKLFWESMAAGGAEAVAKGEAYGLRALLGEGIAARQFTWFDTGNVEAIAATREAYRQDDEPNILEKENEAIWFVGDQVIKFSSDAKFIANRVERVKEIGGFVPEITGSTEHMYRYRKAEGRIMSEAVTIPVFEKLLERSLAFWERRALGPAESAVFRATCMKFYKDKTLERVALFYKNFDKKDGASRINDVEMPPLSAMLDAVDWDWLSDGLPGRFHGDFHFENILYQEEMNGFIFLDWRQEFGGSLSIGDIYYDLAKLLHGLIICHELIAANQYEVDWSDREIKFDFHRKQILVECEAYLEKWVGKSGFDYKKVKLLTALIYLNIAALHHYPYSLLLYALGKQMLSSSLER